MKIVQRSRATYFVWGTSLVVAACSGAQPSTEPEAERPPPVEVTPIGPRPDLGPLVSQQDPPPPISGGTLAATKTGNLAVAADPDRDRVYVVDLALRSIRHTIQLAPKTEPGRVALDNAGRAHVALRSSGEVATIDLGSGGFIVRRACTAPRGVTYDPATDAVWVSCATGDVVALPPAAGDVTRRMSAGRDLRDIISTRKGLFLTRFRAAATLAFDGATGKSGGDFTLGTSNIAWRAVAAPPDPREPEDIEAMEVGGDERAIVAQDPAPEPVAPEPGGYGGDPGGGFDGCSGVGIVSTRLWLVGRNVSGSVKLPSAVLPVDLATNGREFVVVAAGNAHTKGLPQLFVVDRGQLRPKNLECAQAIGGNVPGQAIAAAFDDEDELIVQTREPAALHIMTDDRQRPWKTIVLASESRADTGHIVFHANAGNNIACASCHAEGGDDGHIWEFIGMGPRRTPSLLGTTQHTEPFHWSGDMKDLGTLVDHVFVERMGGPRMDRPQVDALGNFLFKLPAPPKLRDEVPPAGKALFQKRCSSCHAGPLLTNNQTVDVGTGGLFQVPSLVGVAWRAPYLHTGCAKTLFDRFDPACGGAGHADTKDLSRAEIADLVGFLESL